MQLSSRGPRTMPSDLLISALLLHCLVSSRADTETLTIFSPAALEGATTAGSCGYGPVNAAGSVAAISSSSPVVQNLTSSGCGACLQISCKGAGACLPKASYVIATVVDACATCVLNVPRPVFATLADPTAGTAQVDVQQVDCPFSLGNITIRIQDYTAQGGSFLKITPWNIAGSGGLSAVELRSAGGAGGSSWQRMQNAYGAVWQASPVPAPPLDVRLTSDSNESLVARGAITAGATGDVPTGVQFIPRGTPPPPASAPHPLLSAPAPGPQSAFQPAAAAAPTTPAAAPSTPAAAPSTPTQQAQQAGPAASPQQAPPSPPPAATPPGVISPIPVSTPSASDFYPSPLVDTTG